MRSAAARLALAAVGLALLWRWARPFTVEVAGESMAPTLRPGDWLVATRPHRIRRGDVVVVRPPGRDLEAVKRVAGLPGQPAGGGTLGPDEYLLLGDDPAHSTDGRTFGPVRAEAILGVVRFRYHPRPGQLPGPP